MGKEKHWPPAPFVLQGMPSPIWADTLLFQKELEAGRRRTEDLGKMLERIREQTNREALQRQQKKEQEEEKSKKQEHHEEKVEGGGKGEGQEDDGRGEGQGDKGEEEGQDEIGDRQS